MSKSVRENLRESYDNNVTERELRTPWKKQVEERLNFAQQMRSAGLTSLLDAGAATGIDGRVFADAGFDVTCVDLSAENVKASLAKGLKSIEMDVTRMSFDAGAFDAVWSWDCLLHLPKSEWPLALAEISRVLAPNGLFFLGVYGGEHFEGVWEEDTYRPKRFYTFWTDENLLKLLAQQFDVIDFHTHRISNSAPAIHFQAVTMQQKS